MAYTDEDLLKITEAVRSSLVNSGTNTATVSEATDIGDVADIVTHNAQGKLTRISPNNFNKENISRLQGTSENSDAMKDPFKFVGSFNTNTIGDLRTWLDNLHGTDSALDNRGFFRAILNSGVIEITSLPIEYTTDRYIQVVRGRVSIESTTGKITFSNDYNILERKYENGLWSVWAVVASSITLKNLQEQIDTNKQQIVDLIGEAPETLDSIHEIASWINNDKEATANIQNQINANINSIEEVRLKTPTKVEVLYEKSSANFSYKNESDEETLSVTVDAATTEKAGIMTAEDKKVLNEMLLSNTILQYRDVNIEYIGIDTNRVLKNALKLLRIETDNPDVNAVDFRVTTLLKNHTSPVFRFGLGSSMGASLWVKSDENILDDKVRSQDFTLKINGTEFNYTLYFQIDGSVIETDGIIISHSYDDSPYIVSRNAIEYIGDVTSLQDNVNKNLEDISKISDEVVEIKTDIAGTGGLNFLKNPDDAYSDKEKLIITAIKNIGFYDVPDAIKGDEIFVRAFNAQSSVGNGTFGQQIYFANKRIYNETNDWSKASILIAPNVICDYKEHEFDVTVSTGEMAGLRIKVLVDYSVFAGQEFSYGTSIKNKIVFNLERTWKESIQDRFDRIEEQIAGGVAVDSYKFPMEQRNVVWLGSSNVWGDGFLFYSYLRKPLEWLYKSSGKFTSAEDVVADGSVVVENDKKLLGNAVRVAGVGSKISFKHRGSELNICQVIERTSDYAVIGVYDGDTKVAEFTNHNGTIGSDSASFTGDGSHTKFNLDRCFTYNHRLTINGVEKSIALNTQGYGASFPADVDCLVIRAMSNDGSKVIHSLWFKEAPADGAVINVTYDYGETICYVKSTVGENADGVNESPYGDGTISYDPNNPATIGSGLDFRLINEKSFFKYWFNTDEERDVTLKIERGSANSYFTFNFASSVYHNVMNAGIGGYMASTFNTTKGLTAWYNIANFFTPDFVSIGLTGNDDKKNFPRKINRVVNMSLAELRDYPSLEIGKIEYVAASDTYDVTLNSCTITEITARSLKSPSIIGSDVVAGDFVRIGTYTGDLRQVQTRRVESVDTVNGVVTWAEPLHLNEFICLDSLQDLVGQDVSIRSIEQYMLNMELLIKNILSINPKCKVCLFNVYYVDMWMRNTAEYTYIQQWIASEFPANVFVVDAWKYSRDYVECSRKSRTINVTADGGDTISFASPSSLGHWEGIEVWVGDENVYGKDCYPITGYKNTVDPNKSGTALNWESNNAYLTSFTAKGNMQIKWKKNVPTTGTAVTIKLAYNQWSSDWGHPNNADYIDNSIGRAMIYALKK